MEQEADYPLTFFKVGHKEHLEALLSGKIRFGPLSDYKKTENSGKPFHDPHEGLASIIQPGHGEVFAVIPGKGKVKLELAGPFKLSVGIPASAFCLSMICNSDIPYLGDGVPFDYHPPEQMKNYGTNILSILDLEKFNERMLSTAKSKGLEMVGSHVTYVDETEFKGQIRDDLIGLVKLKSDHHHEKEYRYLIRFKEPPEPEYILDIGSIADIAEVIPYCPFQFMRELVKPSED